MLHAAPSPLLAWHGGPAVVGRLGTAVPMLLQTVERCLLSETWQKHRSARGGWSSTLTSSWTICSLPIQWHAEYPPPPPLCQAHHCTHAASTCTSINTTQPCLLLPLLPLHACPTTSTTDETTTTTTTSTTVVNPCLHTYSQLPSLSYSTLPKPTSPTPSTASTQGEVPGTSALRCSAGSSPWLPGECHLRWPSHDTKNNKNKPPFFIQPAGSPSIVARHMKADRERLAGVLLLACGRLAMHWTQFLEVFTRESA